MADRCRAEPSEARSTTGGGTTADHPHDRVPVHAHPRPGRRGVPDRAARRADPRHPRPATAGCSARRSSGTPRRARRSTSTLVEVGPGGVVETWAWVGEPTRKHPLDHPFAFALIKLDGADTALLHAVDAGDVPTTMATGHARDRRAGRTSASGTSPTSRPSCRRRASVSRRQADARGRPERAGDRCMDYFMQLEYHELLVPGGAPLRRRRSSTGKLIGHKCPKCGLVYVAAARLLPDRRDRDDRGRRGRARATAASSPTTRRHAGPVLRPGGDRAVRAGLGPARRAGGMLSLQDILDIPVDEVRVGHARRGRVGRPKASATSTRSATAAGGAPRARSAAGSRPVSPTCPPRQFLDKVF